MKAQKRNFVKNVFSNDLIHLDEVCITLVFLCIRNNLPVFMDRQNFIDFVLPWMQFQNPNIFEKSDPIQ